jgi:hypothetical protein
MRSEAPELKSVQPARCPVCCSALVEPVHWKQVGQDCWELELRCPECGAGRTAALDGAAVHAYNVLLYEAEDEVARQAAALSREWSADVAAEGARFVEALRADQIMPIDF